MVVFDVATDGTTSNCRIVARSGSAEEQLNACESLPKRGKYNPAIGPDGQPVASRKVETLEWAFVEAVTVDR